MPIYGFKPNPKQLVVNKAKSLFGRDAKVVVTGTRLKADAAKELSLPNDSYFVQCHINGELRGTAHTKNWRKAYNLLVIEIEKAFEASLHKAQAV